jgi:hypothetical protein
MTLVDLFSKALVSTESGHLNSLKVLKDSIDLMKKRNNL